jgi:tight adherence protein B
MALLLILVFSGIFIVLVLLLIASGANVSKETKQTMSNLRSVLTAGPAAARDTAVDLRRDEMLSAIPWINRLLLKLELAPYLRLVIYQAGLKWTAGVLILMSGFFFLVSSYLVYLRTGSLLISLLIGLLLGSAPFAFVMNKRTRRFDKFEQELPEALDLMVSSLRAGNSLVSALRLVAFESPDPVGTEFRTCFEEQNYGLELRAAMENLVTRVPLQDLRIVVTAILIQKESGGNLAEVLDKASYVIRERFRLRRQVRVHTAQGRLTGWILSLLPVVLGIALYLISPETISVLWTRSIGVKLLYTAVGMTVAGALIIRRIVNMEV